MTQTDDSVGASGGEGRLLREDAGVGNARPPAEFVHDNSGQKTPGPSRAREEGDERRRFVEGLRRLRAGAPTAVEN